MKLIAEKSIIETSETNIDRTKTMYEVKPDETVHQLFERMGISDKCYWQFDHCEVIIRMIKA